MSFKTKDLEEIKPQWLARLEDALSPSTRAKRRLVLVTSTISLVMVIMGLFPTKIEALGLAFEGKNQRDLLLLLAAVNSYALIGFFIYAWADFHLQARIQKNVNISYIDIYTKGKASTLESLNYFIRIIFDFCIPISYGSYALYRLYHFIVPALLTI